MGIHESRLRDSSGSREPLFERRRGDRMVNEVNEFQCRDVNMDIIERGR